MPVWLSPSIRNFYLTSPTGTWWASNGNVQSLTSTSSTIGYYPISQTPTAATTPTPALYWVQVDESRSRVWDNYQNEQDRLALQQWRREERQAQRDLQDQIQRQIQAPAVLRPRIDDAARARANELLMDHLTPEQQAMFRQHQWFLVEGGRTKRKYRIRAGTLVGNVDVIEQVPAGRNGSTTTGLEDRITHRLCAHINPSEVPHGDQLLAQKLMLEFAEEDFLRVANRHPA